jgi:hypothetical protein
MKHLKEFNESIKKYKYLQLRKISSGECVENIDVSILTIKELIKLHENIFYNDEVYYLDDEVIDRELKTTPIDDSVLYKFLIKKYPKKFKEN